MLIAAKYAKPRRSPPEQACKASVHVDTKEVESCPVCEIMYGKLVRSHCEANAKPMRSCKICEAIVKRIWGQREAIARPAKPAKFAKPKLSQQFEANAKLMRSECEASNKAGVQSQHKVRRNLRSQCEQESNKSKVDAWMRKKDPINGSRSLQIGLLSSWVHHSTHVRAFK